MVVLLGRGTKESTMGAEPLERKLAAIFYADVADYDRLTGEDEEGTRAEVKSYLEEHPGHTAKDAR